MGKKGNKLGDNAARVARLKTIAIVEEIVSIAVVCVTAFLVAIYNSDHAEVQVYKLTNYGMITFGTILFGYLFSYFTLNRYESKVSRYVDTDKLTSGINYEKFLSEAQNVIEHNSNNNYAVLYGDIMNFKYINDTFGYDVGDKLLMYVSTKIKSSIADIGGLYARISADNYVVMIPYKDKNEFVESIYSVIDDICWFEDIQKAHYKPEIYVGIYCSGDGDKELTISEMIDRANMAQKSVKGSTEYHLAYYTEEIRERVIAEKELERRMESALANGEFKAYFQPKYQVDTGEIVGAEALVRWDSPESGFMSPGKFIPLFEQNGFIINLDQYMFETVCKNIREWLDEGIRVVPISVNVSRLQFYRLDFVKRYTKIKEKYDIPDGLLELEFTESIVFENLDILKKIVMNLKKVGFSCSIDDFGSGYSSLNILKNLPMDTLKLDRLFFINDSDDVSRDKALISSVINMSRALEMRTVAEGIENWAQVAFLKEIGCDVIQGYVYSEPIPHARFTNLLEGNRRKELPVEMRRAKDVSVLATTPEDAANKYGALADMLDGMLLEVDYNSGCYEFLSVIGDDKASESAPLKGDDYDDMFGRIITKYVHPDDLKTANTRCSTVAVMSAFYRHERKIITELRLKSSKDSQNYRWSKLTIVRIDPNPDNKDFRALFYIEPARNREDENQTELNDTIKNAVANVCSLIYEFDLEEKSFKKIYSNDELLGEQPSEGDISWLHECYLPKHVVKDEIERVREFALPANVEKAFFEDGKNQIAIDTIIVFNKKEMNAHITIAKMRIGEASENAYKFILLCNVE